MRGDWGEEKGRACRNSPFIGLNAHCNNQPIRTREGKLRRENSKRTSACKAVKTNVEMTSGMGGSVTPDDYCGICKCDSKRQVRHFNKVLHASTVNIYKPSQRKEIFGVVLCEQLGVP